MDEGGERYRDSENLNYCLDGSAQARNYKGPQRDLGLRVLAQHKAQLIGGELMCIARYHIVPYMHKLYIEGATHVRNERKRKET
jgi:hypothetical protein